jgi:hypothetical protein
VRGVVNLGLMTPAQRLRGVMLLLDGRGDACMAATRALRVNPASRPRAPCPPAPHRS